MSTHTSTKETKTMKQNYCANCGQMVNSSAADSDNTSQITCSDCLFFTATYIVTTPDEQLLIQMVSDGTVRVAKRKDEHDSWQQPMWGKAVPNE